MKAGSVGSLYIFTPRNYQFISAGLELSTYSVNRGEDLLKLTFKSEIDSWVDWRVDFLLRNFQ